MRQATLATLLLLAVAPPLVAQEANAPASDAPSGLTFHSAPKPLTAGAVVEDWPSFRGPRRDGICNERPLATSFGEDGPSLVWEVERGESMALRMGFSTATADAIRCIEEHWDGTGIPSGMMGHEIPLFSRIILLSQAVDAFYTQRGLPRALRMARERSGEWFDPVLDLPNLADRG